MNAEENKKSYPKEVLRLIYTEILEGVTKVHRNGQDFFVKHNSSRDANKVDVVRYTALEKAKKEGLPTEQERIDYLTKEELWTEKEEESIRELEFYLKNLKVSLSKMFIKTQQDGLKQKIGDTEEELFKLKKKRIELLGNTAETYSDKKANEYHLQTGLFKEADCKEMFFSDEEFDHLEEKNLSELIEVYNVVYQKFNEQNMKRIALMPYFLNNFYLCDDNPLIFYGKPIVELSFNQISLFGQGKYFKAVLTQSKNPPPDEFMDDPDELINWFEQSKAAEEAMSKLESKAGKSAESNKHASGAQGTSLVGASNEDLKRMGIGQDSHESISLSKEAQEKGGKLNMQDLIKLHGVGKD